MKSSGLVLSMGTIVGLFLSNTLCAQGYVFFSGSGGGPTKAGSIGFEGGKIFPRHDPRYLLGGDFSLAFNGRAGESVPPFFETSVRHEQEINGVAGFRLRRKLFLISTAGLSSRAEKIVFHFPTGPDAKDEVPLYTYFSGSGQVRYLHKNLMVGLGYHSRRGIIAGLGFIF